MVQGMIPPNRPEWLYQPVTVHNLPDVQQQCFEVFKNHYPNIFDGKGLTIHYIDREILKEEAPAYVDAINSLGLLDRWSTSIFVGTQGNQRDTDSRIHIDNPDWTHRCYAFNMPVVNCESSWTVFYKCDEEDLDTTLIGDRDNYKVARVFKTQSCHEIGRLPANQPAWVNVSNPHRPVTNNNETRLLISTRFWPEVHDRFN